MSKSASFGLETGSYRHTRASLQLFFYCFFWFVFSLDMTRSLSKAEPFNRDQDKNILLSHFSGLLQDNGGVRVTG